MSLQPAWMSQAETLLAGPIGSSSPKSDSLPIEKDVDDASKIEQDGGKAAPPSIIPSDVLSSFIGDCLLESQVAQRTAEKKRKIEEKEAEERESKRRIAEEEENRRQNSLSAYVTKGSTVNEGTSNSIKSLIKSFIRIVIQQGSHLSQDDVEVINLRY